jgi:anaerobic magnesium-protoporphyrin IX monomethyl ester cyclase
MSVVKNILFIVPMHITFASFVKPAQNSHVVKNKSGKKYNSLSTDLPLGPLSLSAYLKKHVNVNIKLIDFNAEMNALDKFDHSSFKSYIDIFLNNLEFDPDIVGISSLFSPSFQNFLDCGEISKKNWPNAFVIGGGNIPTNSYNQIYTEFDCEFFDALCFGEGEKPLLNLIKSSNLTLHVAMSDSWITHKKANCKEHFLPKHDFIEDLDEIPFLDYKLCDLTKHGIRQNISSFHANPKGFHIMTSRGCPYLCTFCASHRTHGRSMRYYSIARVESDLRRLVKDYDADTIIFQDDHLMADKERVYQILETIGKLKLNSLYQNGLTLFALDKPMLEAFYNAGVRHLVLPVESGSEKVLKMQMKKPLKLGISKRVATDCRDMGIYTNINIIVGMPGETKSDLNDSLKNLKNIPGNWFNIACAAPLVGSEMHELAQENGYIDKDAIGSDYHKATISTEDWDAAYIQKFQYKMNLELNFVYNNDIRNGAWEWAILGFKNVIRLRSDHAFAHYYSFICLTRLGQSKQAEKSLKQYLKTYNSKFWISYVKEYELPTCKLEALRIANSYELVPQVKQINEQLEKAEKGSNAEKSFNIIPRITFN